MDKRNLLSGTSLGRKVDNQHVLEINPQISNINDFVSVNVNETLYPELDSRDFIGVAQSENILEQEAFIKKIFNFLLLEFLEGGYKPGCDEIEKGGVIASIIYNVEKGILTEPFKRVCEEFLKLPKGLVPLEKFYKIIILSFGYVIRDLKVWYRTKKLSVSDKGEKITDMSLVYVNINDKYLKLMEKLKLELYSRSGRESINMEIGNFINECEDAIRYFDLSLSERLSISLIILSCKESIS